MSQRIKTNNTLLSVTIYLIFIATSLATGMLGSIFRLRLKSTGLCAYLPYGNPNFKVSRGGSGVSGPAGDSERREPNEGEERKVRMDQGGGGASRPVNSGSGWGDRGPRTTADSSDQRPNRDGGNRGGGGNYWQAGSSGGGSNQGYQERGFGEAPRVNSWSGSSGRGSQEWRSGRPSFPPNRRFESRGQPFRGGGGDRGEGRSPTATFSGGEGGRGPRRYEGGYNNNNNRPDFRRPMFQNRNRQQPQQRSPRQPDNADSSFGVVDRVFGEDDDWPQGGDDASDFVDSDYSDEEGMQYVGPRKGDFDGDYVYGVSPVKIALKQKRRKLISLLVQEGMDVASKKDKAAEAIIDTARANNIPISYVSKHDLNMLTDSRPHQGFVLKASGIKFTSVSELPPTSEFKLTLALDEVWDPQNFGALLRTSHVLGCDKVVVCAKNSAPPSATVSKASSGALEVMDICSTSNMMSFLDKSIENGWQVVGTALGDNTVDIKSVPLTKPTILVLGNEGHGIRTNILKRCTHLVRIGGGNSDEDIDSLNVSVTGGILLHEILKGKEQ